MITTIAKEAAKKEVKAEPAKPVSEPNVAGALEILLEDLYGADTIEKGTYDRAMAVLKGTSYAPEKMSKAEINKMFDFV